MKVLVACEYSGRVREAFLARGHDAYSCDLLPAELLGNGGYPTTRHYQCDARDLLHKGWDLLIAHPPCTRLCNSGVRWLAERNLWREMQEAAELFKAFLDAPIPRIAVENPRMHKYAVAIVGRRQDQTIQPWQFGHGETKATGLWLKNLPPPHSDKHRHRTGTARPPDASGAGPLEGTQPHVPGNCGRDGGAMGRARLTARCRMTLRDLHPGLHAALEDAKSARAAREAEVDKAIRRACSGEESDSEIARRMRVDIRRVQRIRRGE